MRFKQIVTASILAATLLGTGEAQQIFNYLLQDFADDWQKKVYQTTQQYDEAVSNVGRHLQRDDGETILEARQKRADDAALEQAKLDANQRVKDIKTTMFVLITVIAILAGIGLCCFLFAIQELFNNKEPDSDAEDEEEEDGETEAADEGEEPALADDFVAKIVIVGASGSGKTLFWSRYTRGLVPKVNIPTKDQDDDRFESKDVMVDEAGSKEIKLLLWDTSGQKEQKDNIVDLLKNNGKNGVIVMYDVMNPQSYETAKDWVQTAKSATKDNIAILLISNKNDISEDKHKVKNSDAEKFATAEQIKFEKITSLNITGKDLSKTFVRFIKYVNKRSNDLEKTAGASGNDEGVNVSAKQGLLDDNKGVLDDGVGEDDV